MCIYSCGHYKPSPLSKSIAEAHHGRVNNPIHKSLNWTRYHILKVDECIWCDIFLRQLTTGVVSSIDITTIVNNATLIPNPHNNLFTVQYPTGLLVFPIHEPMLVLITIINIIISLLQPIELQQQTNQFFTKYLKSCHLS